MRILTVLILLFSSSLFSQEKIETVVDKLAQPVGGKLDVDYVFQSQVIYPENLLKKNVSEDVAIYFTVSSDGEIPFIESAFNLSFCSR